MISKQIKSCLVITYGPVPTSQYQVVEGGGMRAWGLAKGLAAHQINVTVAVNASFTQEIAAFEGITLTNWSLDERFIDLLNSFDAVVVSYCMGNDSVFIANHINDGVQLILDVYVPIYVEVSARDSEDMDSEFRNYLADIQRFNHVLKRGDYFLCASQPQKIFYTGVLGALGVINPRSYRQDRLLVVPFGVHGTPVVAQRNPYLELGLSSSNFVVLWFGGLYPWFRVEELLQSIKTLAADKNIKFVIVGGKDPFNTNPDFTKQYTYAHSFASKHKLLAKSLFFVDWVDFSDRVNWFMHADLVININNPGEENDFSWRTRVMDFVWGEVPILTNGGDVLSEELLAKHAAVQLPALSEKAITASIKKLVHNRKQLGQVVAELRKVKKHYLWVEIVKPLAEVIRSGSRPAIDEKHYRQSLHLNEATLTARGNFLSGVVKTGLSLPHRTFRYAKKHGTKATVRLAKQKLAPKLSTTSQHRARQYIFLSHPINNTGAPLVMLQIIDEVVKKYGAGNIRVITPHIDAHHLRNLRTHGVKVEVATAEADSQTIKLQLDMQKNDFVLMNTLLVYPNYQEFVCNALEEGRLSQAYWFIHEDIAQLTPIKSSLLNRAFIKRLRSLLTQHKLSIFVPSERVRKDYDELLQTKTVKTLPYAVDVPPKLKKPRPETDYTKLNFLLSGTPTDGRKGQFIAIAAFHIFMTDYYQKNPKQYRDFKLHLLPISNDFISQQIVNLGSSLVGKKHLKTYPSLPRQEALNITRSCNVVICCSLNETFGIYIAEAMFMGHVVLRNDSAGRAEQLQEGINGYYINEADLNQFASVIAKLLDIDKTSNQRLKSMGLASQSIIEPYARNSYLSKLELGNKS